MNTQMRSFLFPYTLHLADNALILAQRNSEWCGHGPVLEQDIALTNLTLDLLGQSRNFYQYAAALYNEYDTEGKEAADRFVPRLWKKYQRSLHEDDLAFLRDEHQYLNLQLTELPKGDWAQTVLRQFLFSSFQYFQFTLLQKSRDTTLAAIAAKAIKEITYHTRWSSEWVIRLGDGTQESNRRMHSALEELWPYAGELFYTTAYEQEAAGAEVGTPASALKDDWLQQIEQVFLEATLPVPPLEAFRWLSGKEGHHTEHLGYLLTEMQYLQKTYPDVTW